MGIKNKSETNNFIKDVQSINSLQKTCELDQK